MLISHCCNIIWISNYINLSEIKCTEETLLKPLGKCVQSCLSEKASCIWRFFNGHNMHNGLALKRLRGMIWIYFETAQSLIRKLHFIIYLYTPLSVQEFPCNNTCSRIFGHKGDNGVDDEKCWTSHRIHSTLYNSHLASSTVWSHSLCTLVSAERRNFLF